MALIKRNTAYSVNDIVNTKYGIKLTCTTAGTTSTDPLILDGTSPITDGTVVWEYNNTGGVGSSGGTVLLDTLYSVNYSGYTAVPLLDSLSNYDYIQVQWYLERASDITRHFVGYLDCNEILTTTESTAIWSFNENPTNSGSYYCRILFCGDGSGNLRAVGSGSDSVKISKIIGFKI